LNTRKKNPNVQGLFKMLRCEAREGLEVRRTFCARRNASRLKRNPGHSLGKLRKWVYCKILRILPARNIFIHYCASLRDCAPGQQPISALFFFNP
jgi:hypothetical protein